MSDDDRPAGARAVVPTPHTASPHPPIIGPGGGGKVIAAMVGVMSKVKEIRKEGWNKEGKYKFLYFGDVLAALQDAMVHERLVIAQREVDRRVINKILAIRYEFDAYHESGDYIINLGSHTGACRFEFKSGSTDDKAFSKALVSAEKYGLLALFKIPPDDHNTERTSDGDPDAQGNHDDEPSASDGWRDHESRRDDRRDDRRDERRDAPRDAPRDPPRDPEDRGAADRGVDRREPARSANGPPDDRWEPPADMRHGPPPDDRGPPPDDRPPPASRPRSDATAGFREQIIALKQKLDHAQTVEDAELIWRDHVDLLRQTTDITYEHLRSSYFDRWGCYPSI